MVFFLFIKLNITKSNFNFLNHYLKSNYSRTNGLILLVESKNKIRYSATLDHSIESCLKLSSMKTLIAALITIASTLSATAQTLERNVGHFNKVIASPKINLVLVAGENESVKIDYVNIDPSKINMVVKNHALHIYLDGSKFLEKRKRISQDGWTKKENIYRNASITAYVTYHELDKLVVRGEQQVDVQGAIDNKKFKLSAYGECNITLASLQTGKFKASMYGQHTLKIKAGVVDTQKYKLFGENKIDAQAIQSEEIASATYGESRLKLNANESLRLVTFGESTVTMKGAADLNKLTLGQVSVKR